jgi:hypothetical protein
MKLWFFVEGDTEEELIYNTFYFKYYENFSMQKDLNAYFNSNYNSNINSVFCENCQNVDNVPHKINERFEKNQIDKSETDLIIIICDVEKLYCNEKRKERILNTLNNKINVKNIRFIFFNPEIEELYLSFIDIIEKVIKLDSKQRKNRSLKVYILFHQLIKLFLIIKLQILQLQY